ncbi:MAG: YdeI/OmpD-associated family protein [Saprospiraceae bacterium]|nr:YdeI/OmpD-associated family protein [Saprospiraceae bacterium]
MSKSDPRIDSYIDKAAPFAQTIMDHIRSLVHQACPEVEEKMKWSFPHFDYKGQMMCSMAGFKAHCAFGFWKADLIKSDEGKLQLKDRTAMSHMGRITSIKDLPTNRAMLKMIKEACMLNDKGITVKRLVPKPESRADLVVPSDLATAFSKNIRAKKKFDTASYSYRKEYIEWITEAKTSPTRAKRLATALEWIAEGKGRNWKYERAD